MSSAHRRLVVGLMVACAATASALSVGCATHSLVCRIAAAAPRTRDLRLQETTPQPEVASEYELPAWFDDPAPSEAAEQSALAQPQEPPEQQLTMQDLVNTKWSIAATPREDSWLKGGMQQQEFTLLSDGSVVWGGSAGGFGTGGRWALKDGIIEVIRSTPLGLLTGRDYYMAGAALKVNDKLQFTLEGIIRSYNAIFPVMVIADFKATRLPGRFVRNEEEEPTDKSE
jgi:hypothetical protein|eukprot:jgi/Chrpa1/10748/Chrysochromulina_OHIO_Genome00004943-RA